MIKLKLTAVLAVMVMILAGSNTAPAQTIYALARGIGASPKKGAGPVGVIYKINLAGQRTILTDFGFKGLPPGPFQPTGRQLVDMAVAPDGTLLVLDAEAGSKGNGALFTVDPTT